ncbi:hypothetical protein [Streptomyces yerevanensis]|uniref:hypothetical protein n=1 Tax=Streptomyces yerevanensis TaxID=66378 RepID=UPI000690D617|nr:hypothetical protein [Streptomyces yerevanensis]
MTTCASSTAASPWRNRRPGAASPDGGDEPAEGAGPGEADNFRGTVLVAVEAAARAGQGGPGPVLAEMTRKITGAIDAA